MEIKYSYALNKDGQMVNIVLAIPGEKYFCPNCGNEMITKLGEINAHHFAHKAECSCDGESYLHKIAKLKFKEIYDSSVDFFLEYKTPIECLIMDTKYCKFAKKDCSSYTNILKRLNLKDIYDQCLIEEPIENGKFCADILLRDSKGIKERPLLIEFYHSHKCEPEKMYSGYPIVELKIESEDDLIISNYINFNDKLKFYGFKSYPSKGIELYCVSFNNDDASDLKVSKLNCTDVYSINYADYYECSNAFAVAIDPMSYFEFSLDSRFKKNPPSIGEVACAIAYFKGFKIFENCAICANSRRSKYNIEEIWCTESKNDTQLPKNPKDVRAYACKHSFPNINRIKYIAKYIKNLKFDVLRCDLPLELS